MKQTMDDHKPPQQDPSGYIAAAVLCLLEGPQAPLEELVGELVPQAQLSRLTKLCLASRESRAQAIAGALGRIVVDLDNWSLT